MLHSTLCPLLVKALARADARLSQLFITQTCCVAAWTTNRSRHYLYELDSCRLRRLDMAQTRACLQGKRLVMLGDSVTRYQVSEAGCF